MSSDRRVRAFPFRLKTLGGAVVAALLAADVHAAALGNLTVLSALGQPLQAEIELISTAPDDTGSLVAKVAAFDIYRKANVDYNPVLSSLRFSIDQRGDRHVIRVTSTQPINEPFVDLLLELRGTDSRLVREYLFLLDPPSVDSANAPAVASPATVAPANASAASRQPSSPSSQPAAPRPALEPGATMPAKPARPPAAQDASNNAADAPVHNRRPASGKSHLSLTDISVSPGGNATFTAEERVVMEKAVAEANERVKALEQKVDAMQKLLAATNNLLAELRKHNELMKGATQAEPAAAGAPSASAPAAAPVPAPAASASAASAASATSVDAKPAETAAASAPPPPKPAVPAPPKPRPAPPPASAGLLDILLDNLFALSASGLSLLLLGGAGAYFVRRRRQRQPFDADLFSDSTAVPNSAPAPTAGQEGDGDTTVYIPGFSGAGETSDTGHDPVAEADVYIAYGRDGQAEQILKDALEKQPERHAVCLKLLSIYASRKDRGSFERLAAELHAMTKGQGEEWASAAALGAAIDPGNAMYAASLPGTDRHAAAAAGSAHEVPAIPPAGPVQEESGAPVFDFTRDMAPAAESAPVPGLPPLEAAPPAAGESAPIDLDFALGMPSATAEPAPEPVPAPAAEERPSGSGPIDFDLGLPANPALAEFGEPAPMPEVPEQIVAEIAAEIAAEIPPLEPDPPSPSGPGPIDFDLPELPLVETEPAVAAQAPSGAAASGPGPIDFELPELPLAALEEPAAELAPKAAPSDPAAMDFDFDLPEIPALAQPEEDTGETPPAADADAGASIDLDGMLADLMPPEKKPE